MPKNEKKKKVIVVVGTTASGKTELGVWLAYKFNGEIISADSRQVYRGMDIGTGKDLTEYCLGLPTADCRLPTGKKEKLKAKNRQSKIVKIPYHLIDVVGPRTEYNLAKWLKSAKRAVDDILSRGKRPIVVGGTGLYTQALVDEYNLSAAKPDKRLRARLEKLDAGALFKRLRKLDAGFANGLNGSDNKNKRRLVRYIEVRSRKLKVESEKDILFDYYFLLLGLTWPREVLCKRIYKRLIERLEKEDMVGEVERLHKDYRVSWQRLIGFGLEYKYIALYLTGKLDYDKMVEKLNIAIRRFAKRQITWYRRWERQGANIHWVKNKREAEKRIKAFIDK